MSNMASDAKACFSSKVEYRAVIRYLYLKGKRNKEIHGELAGVRKFGIWYTLIGEFRWKK